ncbi:MAG: hypothetical protein N2111_01405 [Candidatus Sumerlaeaceae bacterium]|nr:hypothetical protein [Candidatus Sumerlaeaceae bacterium]
MTLTKQTRMIRAVAVMILGLLGTWASAQPANDDFANREALVGASGTVTGSNDGATTEPFETDHAGIPGGASVWWTWTATTDGCFSVDTYDSTFDTVLAVYTGPGLGSLFEQASNNNYGTTQTSRVGFDVLAGTQLHIVVDGVAGATGTIVLNWRLVPPVGDVANPSPFDFETTSNQSILLDWADAGGATEYEVWFQSVLIAVTTESQYQIPVLLPYDQYLWQILARNDCATTVSPPWRFSVCPPVFGPATMPSPFDGETTWSSLVRYDWEDTPGTSVYNVYVDGIFYTNTAVSHMDYLATQTAGPHTWQVFSINACDTTASEVWNYCINETPSNPSPANAVVLCVPPVSLSWTGLTGVDFDVYLDGVLIGTTTATSFTLPTPPALGTHTWQVVSRTSCASLASPLWTFDVSSGIQPNAAMWITDGIVHAIAVVDDTIYIGGVFNHVGPADGSGWQPRRNLAAISAITGTATGWNPGADGPVYALAATPTQIFVGGEFFSAGGSLRPRLAALTTTGSLLPLNLQPDGTVRALALDGSTLYVGGDFTSVAGQPRNRLAAANVALNTLLPWNPNADNSVRALLLHQGRLYVGGVFSNVGGSPRRGLAELDPAGGGVLPFDAQCSHYVYGLAARDATLYVGGSFTTIGGQFRQNLAALDLTSTGSALAWNPGANAAVNAVAVRGDIVYVGGFFSFCGGQIRSRLAALDANNGSAYLCSYDANNVVRAINLVSGRLVVGGDFTYFSSAFAQGFGFFGPLLGASRVADWTAYAAVP